MTGARCTHCGDAAPRGFVHCLHCHGWNDLYVGLHPRDIGIDEYRLHRALDYLRNRRKADPVDDLVRKLQRRVAELEYERDLQ